MQFSSKCFIPDKNNLAGTLLGLGMEVEFSPELEIQLQIAAADSGKTPQEFVQDSIRDMLQGRTEFIAAVQQGVLAADRGELVDHEEVTRQLKQLFPSH